MRISGCFVLLKTKHPDILRVLKVMALGRINMWGQFGWRQLENVSELKYLGFLLDESGTNGMKG